MNWHPNAPRAVVSPNTGAVADQPMAVLHFGRSTVQDTVENIDKLRKESYCWQCHYAGDCGRHEHG